MVALSSSSNRQTLNTSLGVFLEDVFTFSYVVVKVFLFLISCRTSLLDKVVAIVSLLGHLSNAANALSKYPTSALDQGWQRPH